MILVESPFRFGIFFEHDLFEKPVSTFPDHAMDVKQAGKRHPLLRAMR